jgi:F-type H+-transporting ATPase subunit epsilon
MILEIVSPEAKLFSGEINSVSLPGVDGKFQILKNHAPIVATLKDGIIDIKADSFDSLKEGQKFLTKVNDQHCTLAINSGTIELKNNKAIVLVD